MGDLSRDFNTRDFQCPCCKKVHVDMNLIDGLQRLRDLKHLPITVLSGHRCAKHNSQIGGTYASQHVKGRAADIQISGLTILEMYLLACEIHEFNEGGIGIYPDGRFIHVDVRDTGRARWARLMDRYVGIWHGVGYTKG